MVELKTAFDIALAVACGAMGWLMKALFARLKSLEETDKDMTTALNDLRVELPTNYTSKADFKQMGDAIFGAIRASRVEMVEAIHRVEDRLAEKSDKQ